MKTIHITIDKRLLQEVDMVVRHLGISRSAFLREALQEALRQLRIKAMEQQQIAGYQRFPAKLDEFDVWQSEQVWTKTA